METPVEFFRRLSAGRKDDDPHCEPGPLVCQTTLSSKVIV
jgi:hypothetical protein